MNQELLQPQYLKKICAEYHLLPSKSYGQHYLISDAPIRRMIAAAELNAGDTVVEIGPGFGVLTLAVAPLVERVVAFEIEKKLEPYWAEKISEHPNIHIVWGNAIKKFSTVSEQFSSYKVLANLPYQVTSDALRILLEAVPTPQIIVVMVQKEVAERLCARPGEMSLLSVAVQYYGTPTVVAAVPPGAFWPRPAVDSAVVAVRPRQRPAGGPTPEAFFRIVRTGFSHKRKQLWRNLAQGLKLPEEQVKVVIKKVAGNDRVRAEELTVADWQVLAQEL